MKHDHCASPPPEHKNFGVFLLLTQSTQSDWLSMPVLILAWWQRTEAGWRKRWKIPKAWK